MSGVDDAQSVARVVAAARDRGVKIEPREFAGPTPTARAAADEIGVSVAEIANSLIFDVDGDLVLAITSGARRVDTQRLAYVAGGSECGRADKGRILDETGFRVGGVAPCGHTHHVKAFVDRNLLDFDSVWAAAGTPHACFEITPADLTVVAGAAIADFTE